MRIVHDATVAGVYEAIRQVNRLVGVTLAAAIDVAEELRDADPTSDAAAPSDAEEAKEAEAPTGAARRDDPTYPT